MSVNIEFDKDGCCELLDMFNEVLKGKEFELSVEFDSKVIKIKKNGTIKNSIILCDKNTENSSVLTLENGNIIWKIGQDDIEIGIDQFTECKKQGYFFPAEFIRVQTPKNKKPDYMYCELVDRHNLKKFFSIDNLTQS